VKRAADIRDLDPVLHRMFPQDAPGLAMAASTGRPPVFLAFYGSRDPGNGALVTGDTAFRIASLTKQFTAAALLLLESSGTLSLQAQVGDFFPGWPAALGNPRVTHLLTHTSGLPDYEILIPPGQEDQLSDEDVLDLILEKGRALFGAGTGFRYSNTGYCLGSLIVQKASGLSFGAFLNDHIFKPLGMTGSVVQGSSQITGRRAMGHRQEGGSFRQDDQSLTSATLGDGGVYTTLKDYLKWLDGLEARYVLPGLMTEALLRPRVRVMRGLYYGYGWFQGMGTDGARYVFHAGETVGSRSLCLLNRDTGGRVVLFANCSDGRLSEAFTKIVHLLDIRFSWLEDGGKTQSLPDRLSDVYQDVFER